VAWIRSEGGFVNERLAAARSGVSAAAADRGLFAAEDVPSEAVVAVPLACCIAVATRDAPPGARLEHELALRLLVEASDAASPFAPYLATLPRDAAAFPVTWASAELARLFPDPGDPLPVAVAAERAAADAAWAGGISARFAASAAARGGGGARSPPPPPSPLSY